MIKNINWIDQEVVVNCLNIAKLSKEEIELFKTKTSEKRLEKARRFRIEVDAVRCVSAELLLKFSLSKKGCPFKDIQYVYNEYGKPSVDRMNEFYFNISHAGDWVVVAYGDKEVGVDIEEIKDGLEDIADNLFGEEEKRYIYATGGAERSSRLIHVWTIRESYIKYLGKGFSQRMDTFSIDMIANKIKNSEAAYEENIFVNSYSFIQGYYLTICSENSHCIVKEIKAEEILRAVNQ